MNAIHIERPTLTLRTLNNDRYTYEVTTSAWQNFFVRNGSGTEKAVKKLMTAFEKSFDKEAAMIENGECKPHNIMKDFVDNGLFRRIRKIDPAYNF